MGLIDFGSLAVQAVNLAIVAYVLRKFLFLPYLAHLDEETKKREELAQAHAEAQNAVEAAKNEAHRIIETAKQEGKSIRAESKSLAKQEASLITFEANKEADAIRAKAETDIGAERRAMEVEMKAKIVDVALKINEKIFGKSEANARFVESAAKDL